MKKKTPAKEYLVIGLGRFGRSIAMQLEANGCRVLAIDIDEKNVNQISDYVTLAMCLDITNEEAMEELGARHFDGAVIAIGSRMESAVLATIWAKEQGVPYVIAKAYDATYGKILSKVGADEIIYPEREMGRQLANRLAFNHLFESIELSSDYSIADLPVPDKCIGKNLRELNLRNKYNLNVIAIKRNGELIVNPPSDLPLVKGDYFILIGTNEMLTKLQNRF